MQESQEEILTNFILASVIAHASRKDQFVENAIDLKKCILKTVSELPVSVFQGLVQWFKIEHGAVAPFSQDSTANRERENLMANLLLFHRNDNLNQLLCSKLLENYVISTPSIDIIEVKTQEVIDYSKWFKEDKLEEPQRHSYEEDRDFLDTYIGFGTKHKHLLKASKEEEKVLNQISVTDTVFTEIEQCALETAKLFLKLLQAIETFHTSQGKQFFARLEAMDRRYRKRHYAFYSNEEYWMWKPSSGVLSGLIKYAENGVRAFYRHTRKRDADNSLSDIQEHFPKLTLEFIQDTVQKFSNEIEATSTLTEIALNASNRARWKEPFKAIKENASDYSSEELDKQISRLLKLNGKNPSLANIYWEASKVCASKNKTRAIQYYFQYIITIEMQNKSAKDLPVTVMKKLFANENQKNNFDELLKDLTDSKNLGTILKRTPDIYKKKRKAITLNAKTIAKVNDKYKETVDKLGAALMEDVEEINEMPVDVLPKNDLKPENAATVRDGLSAVFESDINVEDIRFDTIQKDLLKLLVENDNELSNEQVADYSRSKSRFAGQLINGINEHFMEVMEDLLIEEEEDHFLINTDYLEIIKTIIYVD